MGHKHEEHGCCGGGCGCGGMCKGEMTKEQKLASLDMKEKHLQEMLAHIQDVRKTVSTIEEVDDSVEG